jgi:hypothetical protein
MLNTFLPALIGAWLVGWLLVKLGRRINSKIGRVAAAVPMFAVAFISGAAIGMVSLFASLWAMSGLPLNEFMNTPVDAEATIESWARMAPLGALIGAGIAVFRRWQHQN